LSEEQWWTPLYHFTSMELILVRHGLPIRRENVDGPADPDLSTDGHAQAKHFAEYMSLEHIDAIYTSPMKRAMQTAAPLAHLKNIAPIVVDGVAEYDQHSNEYIPVEELKASNDPRWQEIVKGGWDSDEPAEEFSTRVNDALNDIVRQNKGGRVVVTCHGGVINEYLSKVLGLQTGQFFYPNYTSIHRIAASNSGHRSVLSVNETAHLRGTGLPIGLFHG
jgi:2,3-bisphosphoglycerate-dependent phosphoglycerate mutase